MPSPSNSTEANQPHGFATTRWTVVLRAGQESSREAQEALECLCQSYWYPLYAHARRSGCGPEDAQDLTQQFFANLLDGKFLRLADPRCGRFRSFLLSSLDNFLKSEWRKQQARKRGGGQWIVSLDQLREAETRFLAEPADPATTPDRAFEKQWAMTLLERVLSRLREQFVTQGRPDHFDTLKVFVWGDPGTTSQVEVAARLGVLLSRESLS